MKQIKSESAHLSSTSSHGTKSKGKKIVVSNKKYKGSFNDKKVKMCIFCKDLTHMKNDGPNYHIWRVKKGIQYGLVCTEANLISISSYTCWLNSGATTYISMSMKGCLNYQKPSEYERYIYMRAGNPVEVIGIGTFRFLLSAGYYFCIK